MTALPDPALFHAPTIAEVSEEICAHYGLTRIELASSSRRASVTGPRAAAYYLAARLTGKSLPAIGSALGGRDHTTVLFGRDKFAARLAVDPILAEEVAELERRILERAAARAKSLPPDMADIDLPAVAMRVVKGGPRAAISLSVIEIMAICGALHEHFTQESDCDVNLDVDDPASAPVRSPCARELLRALVFADRSLRARDSRANLWRLRYAIDAARDSGDRRFAAFLAAHAAVEKALWTAGERNARERREAALQNLIETIERED
ncbi:helix-turn-helix domain-containing protein [Methylocystis heyeri]|uniref:Chromosomal replication initiator DnaA C-terminal domain-containing protein n=1 Tax=Methylocystis heyeri TaxID=391905 RepID=A0A6B8KGF6_9HYPH|nr:helix-turn-helix domain-containing protein [Methylocystis heyeri]QGM46712.1 hypothetical protein H2LOC_013970 [Methylocystis heyeri]